MERGSIEVTNLRSIRLVDCEKVQQALQGLQNTDFSFEIDFE